MAMSKQDWAACKDRLESLYVEVTLDCDGYKVSLYLARISAFRNAIRFYVNGWFKGRWLVDDCEERRRFVRKIIRRVYKKDYLKGISKRTLKRMGIDPEKTFETYCHYWTNFTSLRRHLEKNNQEITLIADNTASETTEAACG